MLASGAPLAQSVERFHGKEEVFGSTPEGGSACRRCRHVGEWLGHSPACRKARYIEFGKAGESCEVSESEPKGLLQPRALLEAA